MLILTSQLIAEIAARTYNNPYIGILKVNYGGLTREDFYQQFKLALQANGLINNISLHSELDSVDVVEIIQSLPGKEYGLGLKSLSPQACKALTECHIPEEVIISSVLYNSLSVDATKELSNKCWRGWFASVVAFNDLTAEAIKPLVEKLEPDRIKEIRFGSKMHADAAKEVMGNYPMYILTSPRLVVQNINSDVANVVADMLPNTWIRWLGILGIQSAKKIKTLMAKINDSSVYHFSLAYLNSTEALEAIKYLPRNRQCRLVLSQLTPQVLRDVIDTIRMIGISCCFEIGKLSDAGLAYLLEQIPVHKLIVSYKNSNLSSEWQKRFAEAIKTSVRPREIVQEEEIEYKNKQLAAANKHIKQLREELQRQQHQLTQFVQAQPATSNTTKIEDSSTSTTTPAKRHRLHLFVREDLIDEEKSNSPSNTM